MVGVWCPCPAVRTHLPVEPRNGFHVASVTADSNPAVQCPILTRAEQVLRRNAVVSSVQLSLEAASLLR